MSQAPARTMPDSLPRRAAALEYLIRQAREGDVSTFNRLCYKDKAGKRWDTQPFHLEWHDLIRRYPRLVILAPAGSGKTEQVTRSLAVQRIGRDPASTGAIISNVADQAIKRLRIVAEDIKTDPGVRAVYPHLRPEKRPGRWEMWTDTGFIVERPYSSQTPTLSATGIGGPLLGSRLDWIVFDDPCDMQNTSTPAQREKAIKWVLSTALSRLDGAGSCVVIQTSWHDDDIGHALAREHGFHLVRYSACDENCEQPLWAARFPTERLRQIKATLGAREFARTMRNEIMTDEFRRITDEAIRKALDRGRGVPAGVVPAGAWLVVAGLDPAGGKKARERRGDLCAFVVVAVMPNGDRQVVHIEAGRWTSPQMRDRIGALWASYGCMIAVEDNGVQDWLRQEVVADSAIPIVGRTTGADKWNPATGVESIGLEMDNGKWIVPATPEGKPATPEIAAWIDEMKVFQHGAHTGDRLMACTVARSEIRDLEAERAAKSRKLDFGGAAFAGGLEQRNEWA